VPPVVEELPPVEHVPLPIIETAETLQTAEARVLPKHLLPLGSKKGGSLNL
jgi:hypothetical protein